MAIKNLEKMDIYNPTNYVNNSEPDIDAYNLNKTEKKLEETVTKANEIIDALKTLISTVQANSDNTVPSSSLAYAMQQEITKNKEDIATANSNLVSKLGTGSFSFTRCQKIIFFVHEDLQGITLEFVFGDEWSRLLTFSNDSITYTSRNRKTGTDSTIWTK